MKDGDHIKPAIASLPAIFEFSVTHKHKVASKKEAADSDD